MCFLSAVGRVGQAGNARELTLLEVAQEFRINTLASFLHCEGVTRQPQSVFPSGIEFQFPITVTHLITHTFGFLLFQFHFPTPLLMLTETISPYFYNSYSNTCHGVCFWRVQTKTRGFIFEVKDLIVFLRRLTCFKY